MIPSHDKAFDFSRGLFTVSNTSSHEMSKLWGITKGEMQKKHILFQEEDRETYIRALLEPTRSMEVSASS